MGDGASETPAPLRRERPLGPHVLVRPLAHGRRSVLWLARDVAGRAVVLRLPHGIDAPAVPLPPEQDAALERRVLGAIGAQPVPGGGPPADRVEILGTGLAEGRRWIAVEWVDGTSLEPLGPLAPELVASLGIELAVGLAAAPAPYGALRPTKVLVDRRGRLRLADTLLESRDPTGPASGSRAPDGGRAVAAPEGGAPSPAGDVWALAWVLRGLLGPRDGTDAGLAAASATRSALDAVLRDALDPDPGGRPGLAELAARLERLGPTDAETTRAALARRVATASPRVAERSGPGASRSPATAPLPRTGAVGPAIGAAAGPIWVDTAETSAPPVPATLPTPIAGGASPAPGPSEPAGAPGPPAPELPDGRFRILARLGEGGMGEVWKAYDGELDELVALKLVGAEASDQAELQARLRREVRLARKIRSPRVCRVHELLELPDGRRAVSMELLAGRTLSQLAREGLPIDYRRFAGWGADVAEGLDAAHRLGIVHRDLKPDNVMVGADDRAVILDFGVALSSEAPEPGAARLTQRNVILGTVPYMAPEQLSNLELDGRTDLYALGLILGELITGETPFGAPTYHEVLERRVIHARPYVLRDIDPGAPPALAEVIDALLRPNRDERPADAATVAERLRAVAEGRAVPTAPATVPIPEPGPHEASPASAVLSLDDPRPPRSGGSPALRLAAAASVVGVLAFGAGLVHLHRQDLRRAAADAGVEVDAGHHGAAGGAGPSGPADAGPAPDAGTGPDDAGGADEGPRPTPDARPRPRSEPLPEPIPM